MEELCFDNLIDDTIGVINSFLDFRSTAALKQTCKRMNLLLDYNFYTDEYAEYNSYYNGVYPLLLKDMRELVVSNNLLRGICTVCGEEKEINSNGMIDVEKDIETPEKFERLKLRNIICENITVCSFSNLKFLHLHEVTADYFHFPISLNTLALEQCEIDDITLPKNLEYLLLDTVDIESIDVNDNLKVIRVTDSIIGLEGDPQLKVFIAAYTRFYRYQTVYGTHFEILILSKVENLNIEEVTVDKLFIDKESSDIKIDSYKEIISEEELETFKIY